MKTNEVKLEEEPWSDFKSSDNTSPQNSEPTNDAPTDSNPSSEANIDVDEENKSEDK